MKAIKAIIEFLKELADIFYGPESHAEERYRIQKQVEEQTKYDA